MGIFSITNWFHDRKRKRELLRGARLVVPASVAVKTISPFPLSIVGWGLMISQAMVISSREQHLVVLVNQPYDKMEMLQVNTPKASLYKEGDIVKLYGIVKRQTLPILIEAISVNMIGRKEDYESVMRSKVVN